MTYEELQAIFSDAQRAPKGYFPRLTQELQALYADAQRQVEYFPHLKNGKFRGGKWRVRHWRRIPTLTSLRFGISSHSLWEEVSAHEAAKILAQYGLSTKDFRDIAKSYWEHFYFVTCHNYFVTCHNDEL